MPYLVTTHSYDVPNDMQIFMVDGTVPGLKLKDGDYHWDHHRQNGKPVQVLEMPFPKKTTLSSELANQKEQLYLTTRVDADAAVAAAWLQLPKSVLEMPEVKDRLEAIAWDCDHLVVPENLKKYADFAFKVVAGLKIISDGYVQELGFNQNRLEWEQHQYSVFDTLCFERHTNMLIDASSGRISWAEITDKAEPYWEEIQKDIQIIKSLDGAIRIIDRIAVFDSTIFDHMVDPRSFLQALRELNLEYSAATITVKTHKLGGMKYTLGTDPLHKDWDMLDYTKSTYKNLSLAENKIENTDLDREVWGGRRSVGGSGWNHPSKLTPEQVVEIVKKSAGLE